MKSRHLSSWRALAVAASLALAAVGQAAVTSYTYTQTTNTYAALAGATTITLSPDTDDGVSAAQTLPFTFTYGGTPFTTIFISSNGFIQFGGVAPAVTEYDAFANLDNSVSVWSGDLLGSAAPGICRTLTTGAVGSRIYTVEWSNWRVFGLGTTVRRNFQIKLYETSNRIEANYGPETDPFAATDFCQVGIRGVGTSDFKGVTGPDWATLSLATSVLDIIPIGPSSSAAPDLLLRWEPTSAPTVSIASNSVAEGNAGPTALTINGTVENPSASPIDITFSTSDGTATLGDSDYVQASATAFQIPASAANFSFNLTVNGDAFPEPDETFGVSIAVITGGVGIGTGNATATITDDDFVCGATETFASASQTAMPGWNVTNNDVDVVVWEFGHPTTYDAGPTAIAPIAPIVAPFAVINSDAINITCDSELISPSFNFSTVDFVKVSFHELYRGITGCTATVDVSTDGGGSWTTVGTTRTTANVGNVGTGAPAFTTLDITALAAGQANVTIRWHFVGNWSWWWVVDNVTVCTGTLPAGVGGLSIGDASVTEGNAGTSTMTFPITIVNPSATPFSVDYQTVDGSATTADNDYVGIPVTTLNIPGSTTSTSIAVTINGDVASEGNDQFTVVLSNASPNVTLVDGSATGTIVNNDLPTLAADAGYGYETGPTDRWSFTDLASEAIVPYTPQVGGLARGGDFKSTTDTYYFTNRTQLFSQNVASGAISAPITLTGLPFENDLFSMSYNPDTGEMWGMTLNVVTFAFEGYTLGTINTTTGAYTMVFDNQADSSISGVAIAHANDGTMYVIDANFDAPPDMHLSTFAAPSTLTPVGDLGIDTFAFLDADVDPDTDILYMPIVAFTAANSGFYSISTSTGVATQIGNLYPAGTQFSTWSVFKGEAVVGPASAINWSMYD